MSSIRIEDETRSRVYEAMAAVSRANFLPDAVRHLAATDSPVHIGWGATNSQPSTVARMLELLAPKPGDCVLDVGSGSGWTTALLAYLVGETGTVIGVERRRPERSDLRHPPPSIESSSRPTSTGCRTTSSTNWVQGDGWWRRSLG